MCAEFPGMIVLLWGLAGMLCCWLHRWRRRDAILLRSRRSPDAPVSISQSWQKKPDWVGAELIRIKAFSPNLGCRLIAEVFNRQFAHRRMSVSKSYVARLLRDKKLAILRMRLLLKHRVPRPMDRNRIWAMDITGKADLTGKQRLILGVLDHGSRVALALSELTNKSSLQILSALIRTIHKFGMPVAIRTDNEACFTSRTMQLALTILGVRHQRTELHCPWQNGRVERFFGTLKQHLNKILPIDGDDLRLKLVEFRAWYNHVRPHQHLGGRTPAEVWAGAYRRTGEPMLVSLWDGRLHGWLFPP